MTYNRPTALERSFELAESGQFDSVTSITAQLRREGLAGSQITGRTLHAQLRELIKKARAAQTTARDA